MCRNKGIGIVGGIEGKCRGGGTDNECRAERLRRCVYIRTIHKDPSD